MTWLSNVTTNSPRQRTGSGLKWLVNERTTAVGEVSRTSGALEGLLQQLQDAQRRADVLATHVAERNAARDLELTAVADPDLVIALEHPGVALEGVGAVQAWAGKYGKRGALKMFVLDTARAAAFLPVTAPAIAQTAAAALRIPLRTPEERQVLRRRVTEILTRARDTGQVELLGGRQASQGGPGEGLWRTEDSFARLVADLRLAGHEHPAAHTFGSEVGG